MKKIIVGLAAAAAIAAPLAVTATATAAPAPAKATGTVTWDYQGQVTGTVVFDANAKTGGTLDYQNSNGQWLHAVVTPGSVKTVGTTATFDGVITSGSPEYVDGYASPDISVKVVDGGTSGRNGDMIAVYANAGSAADNEMTAGTAGVVTAGNLTVF